MNIRPKNKKNRKHIIAILAVLFIVLAVTGFFAWNHFRKPSDTKPTSNESGQQESTTTTNSSEDSEKSGTEENPIRDTPPSEKITAQLSIPSHQVDGYSILLNVAIDKSWPSTATCTLNGTGPTSVNRSETIFAQAQISGCQFKINDLKPGSYAFAIFAKNGSEKTNTETINITIPQ